MSERLLQSSQQMTKSWEKIIFTPGCFKTYEGLDKDNFDKLKILDYKQLAKRGPYIQIIALYLQALEAWLNVPIK